MKNYPLKSITLEQAKKFQFKLIDLITKEFNGEEILDLGDLGVVQPLNQPNKTRKVEKVIANFFEAEDCVLVIGSGTGAIREAIASTLDKRKILIHASPVYSTTETTLNQLGYEKIISNFNDYEEFKKSAEENDIDTILIQYTRQVIEDSYELDKLIKIAKSISDTPIITDDNYAVMKVDRIGVQMGADLSCFSMFKLLGPESIGCVVGKKKYIDKIRKFHYSGGSQVQGFIAMDALRSLVYTPVSFAIQAEETEKIVKYIRENNINFVEEAHVANSQSKVILIKFTKPIAKEVLENAKLLGAASHPVGSESKYEIAPMFYRISGSMREKNLDSDDYWIRINPMRSGHETVLRILEESIGRCSDVSRENN